ncbi:MAG: ADP-ribose pyrophosphatase, partial [Cognaticolwellia sp.]
AEKLLAEGKIANAATIIALQWLALNLDKLKASWK